ncbi:protein FAM177A1 [Echeneis naucrates]|uniref:protein FAM177A1 n=1 Tax=Echeneis naucrates TaxID=173247 RepID=UPI001113D37D|nr:protein FAM177A1-like [Echeneis naucrates]
MNNQEGTDTQETDFSSPTSSTQKRIIHFSSGETLEEENSEEEEEQSSSRPPFREPSEKPRVSFKTVAVLIGRVSLLTCDFLGERLAGALGLNTAKYQYAIDQYKHDHKKTSRQPTDVLMEGQAGLTPGTHGSHYGATAEARCPADPQDNTRKNTIEGYNNSSYQADEHCLK